MSDSVTQQFVYRFGPEQEPMDQAGVELLGGKGASLAAMSRAGFPVPPGFTISTACCAWVEQHGGQWPERLESEIRGALRQLEVSTQRRFGCGPRPLFVAVRSGAAVSMPGMMDTILNCGLNPSVADCFPSADAFWTDYGEHIRQFAASVAGISLAAGSEFDVETRVRRLLAAYEAQTGRSFPTDPWESLRQSIGAVFDSWHSERAKAYRKHHDIRGITGTAVNVQAMFPSQRSGVLFTVDPNDPSSGQMILEASWGLGEAVVSGAVTPDVYAIDRVTLQTTREVAGLRPGSEPALNPAQRKEIAELGLRIEAHFGVPADLEWGIAEGSVALLQSRPIRGLEIHADAERGRQQEVERLTRLAGRDTVVWVVHNLSETLPAPTPLTWDLVRWFMSVQGGYGRMYRRLGQHPCERVDGRGFLELIAGRIYVDPRRAAEFHFGKIPFEYDPDEILRDRSAVERAPTRFNIDRTDSLFFFRVPGLLWNMARGARRMSLLSRTCVDRFRQQMIPQLEAFLQVTERVNLSVLTTAELLHELQCRCEYVLGELAAESLIPGYFAGLAHDRLRSLLTQVLGPDEGEQLAARLTAGLEGDITVEQNCLLFEVASGRRSVAEFLANYGHRAANEMELSQPRWREDPPFVDQMINRLRGAESSSPRRRHDEQVAMRHDTESTLPARLASAGGSSLRERVESAMRQAQQFLPYRELGKFQLMRGYETLRAVLVELGRRWDVGRDLFFLQREELASFEANRSVLEDRIAERKLRWRSLQKLSLPDTIDSRELQDFGWHRPQPAGGSGDRLVCRPIATGYARGTARVVFDPGSIAAVGNDEILVCPSTDPGWTPLFVSARGLIVERGGVLSHGAIVARDFGIPAVVLEDATRIIRDGAVLEVDAIHGTVVVLSNAREPRADFTREPVP